MRPTNLNVIGGYDITCMMWLYEHLGACLPRYLPGSHVRLSPALPKAALPNDAEAEGCTGCRDGTREAPYPMLQAFSAPGAS